MREWQALVRARLRPLRIAPAREREIVEEIAQELEEAWRAAIAAGLPDPQAREAALRHVGDWEALAAGVERAEAPWLARHTHGTARAADNRGGAMTALIADVRGALRWLRRQPVFVATTVLLLALGIGAATTVYSLLDGVVLRALPYGSPDRLVVFWDSNQGRGIPRERVSPVNFLDYRRMHDVFEDAAAWWTPDLALTDTGLEPVGVRSVEASGNFFDVLGVQPAMGAGFPRGDALHQPELHAVISDRLWRTRYGADPAIVGKAISVNGRPNLVLGVMPPGFTFPGDTDLWLHLRWDLGGHSRGAHFMDTVARLRPGVGLETAQRAATRVAERLEREFPQTNTGWRVHLQPLDRQVVGGYRTALMVLMATVGLLLLIACVNVANLLLVRGADRGREIAVRTALGASAPRLLRQFFLESLLLALAGGVGGLALAAGALQTVRAVVPFEVPRLQEVALNLRVFGFALAASACTALVFGLGPSLLAARQPPVEGLRDQPRGTSGSRTMRRVRGVLVAVEVALAIVMLCGAGLIIRSVSNLARVDPGFRPGRAAVANLRLPAVSYAKWADVEQFYTRLADRLREQAGVGAAGVSNFLPFDPGWRLPFEVAGVTSSRADEEVEAQYHSVSDGFFAAMQVPIVAGRDFSDRDTATAPGVAIVNQTFADRYLRSRPPVGARLTSNARGVGPLGRALIEKLEYEVVGVVADVRNTALEEPAEPAIYVSTRQFPFRSAHVVVRGALDEAALMAILRNEVRRLDGALPLNDLRPLARVLDRPIERPRALAGLLTGFAAAALVLAAVGIYGLLVYVVRARRTEFGIRLALGAQRGEVVGLVLRDSLITVGAGALAGLAAAVVLATALRGWLFEVGPADPLVLAAVAGCVVIAALTASLVPARLALRLSPIESLRNN